MSTRRREGAVTKLPALYFETARDMILFWLAFAATALPVFYGLVSSFWVLVVFPVSLLLVSGPAGRRYGFVRYIWNGIWFGSLGAILLALGTLPYR